MTSATSRLRVSEHEGITRIEFVDRNILDEANIQELGQELFQLIEEENRKQLLLNFSSVEVLSSAALGKLITLHRKLQAVQGKLVLCKIAKDILDVFKITKLDRILTITPDEQSGLQAF